jgi:hypothetical protein
MIDQPQTQTNDSHDLTFYTIGNAPYFPGVVALLNSLRVVGHHHELVVLDCGFTPQQRSSLSQHCTLVQCPSDQVTNPTLFKAFPYLLDATGIVVIIDSDIVVTKSLQGLTNLANQGKICAFPDPEYDRWFAGWQQLFGLRAELRRQMYVNAGFLVFDASHWPHLLERWWQACQAIKFHPTIAEGAPDGPSSQADQDALNAILMSEVPLDALALQPEEEAPTASALWRDVHVVNTQTLACIYRGYTTMLLHNSGSPKPWETRAWKRIRHNAYVRLLHRLLYNEDMVFRMNPEELPIWLRPGILGQISIFGVDMLNRIVWGILGRPMVGPLARRMLHIPKQLRSLKAAK